MSLPIVEKLRVDAQWNNNCHRGDMGKNCSEAADTIEALYAALEWLEAANKALCAKRTREVYLAIEAEARDELYALDEARAAARGALAKARGEA